MNNTILIFNLSIIIMLVCYLYIRKSPKLKVGAPVIQVCENFLSKEICEDVISSYSDYKPSKINNGKNTNYSINRTSETIHFKDGDSDLIDSIKKHISKQLRLNPLSFEPGQLTKYEKGQKYGNHYDFYVDKNKKQREYTVLIYLNTLKEKDGGETKFKYGKIYRPNQGLALCWRNIDKKEKGLKNTLHESLPILTDTTKYILTFWTKV